ncbi:MAG: hypothetical protein WCG87_03245 [Bacteroidota bacterium]
MKDKMLFVVIAMLMLPSCNSGIKTQLSQTPYNYNKNYVHVFSMKIKDATNTLIFNDTLGLFCTDTRMPENHDQKCMNWTSVSIATNNKYKLNESRINRMRTGQECTTTELFIHPPRDIAEYQILEICPYPDIEFPLAVGKEWHFDLNVEGGWSPSDTIKWVNGIVFSSQYKVVDTITIALPMGKIPCYHIHATGTSSLGTSSTDIFYSFQYGIVKLYYLPLDHTSIEMNMITGTDDLDLLKSNPALSPFLKLNALPKYD